MPIFLVDKKRTNQITSLQVPTHPDEIPKPTHSLDRRKELLTSRFLCCSLTTTTEDEQGLRTIKNL